MKKFLLITFALLIGIYSADAQKDMSGEMYDLAKIKSGIRNRRVSSYDKDGYNKDRKSFIAPDSTLVLADIKGAGVINHIWITISPTPDKLSRNDIILKMYWDGNEEPSVVSPIGPFFGQGWQERYNYNTFALTAGPTRGTGLCCYFTMPFEKGARIEIENQADNEIRHFYYYIDYLEMKKLPEDMGRFHAWYNREVTETGPEGETEWGVTGPPKANVDGSGNYVFADIKGKGHFVGVNYYVQCPTPLWYGEGDDMWRIDGEDSFSLLGTGTEDFFNTAWCPKEKFEHIYFGSPRVNDDIGWLGRTHVYRFFIQDPIYFEKSLLGSIEHGHNNCLTLDIATVSYWYQDKAVAVPAIPDKAGRKLKPMINERMIHRWRDAWRKSMGNDPALWGNEVNK